ncbi:MAG: hypothetical protein ABH824_05665 [Nanoarchaeota archaeon]
MGNMLGLFDIDGIEKLARNLTPTVAPVSFIYLFLINQKTYLFVLALLSLLFLAFYINMGKIASVVSMIKLKKSKPLSLEKAYLEVIGSLAKNRLYWISLFTSYLWPVVAVIILYMNLSDQITYVLFFLCLFAIFHKVTYLMVHIYHAVLVMNNKK